MPFSKKCDYTKLKSNLQLCQNRITLKQKKKTELSCRGRQEIAELLKINKVERCRIKTEQIIREDYLCEVLDIIQTYCELLLTRFGTFESCKEIDPSLEKPIATLIWCTPRLSTEIAELATIKKLLEAKCTKEYVDACLENKGGIVNPVVVQKLSLSSPSPSLVESYMVEIAKTYNVDYEPDQKLLNAVPGSVPVGFGEDEGDLINFEPAETPTFPELPEGYAKEGEKWEHGKDSGSGAPYPEQSGFPQPEDGPPIPLQPPAVSGPADFFGFDESEHKPPSYDATMFPSKPDPPAPADASQPPLANAAAVLPPCDLPDPRGPSTGIPSDDTDFDELQRRFNQLTNRK